MSGTHFDALARSLHSRRTFMHALAALGAGVGIVGDAEAARKKKKGGKSHLGCTKHDNNCSLHSDGNVHCPDAPSDLGVFCIKTNKGKPICAAEAECFPCKRNADCVAELGPTARCVKKCPFCQAAEGVKSVCFIPFTTAPAGQPTG